MKKSLGFSLVELTLVLAVIALIIAGILAARSIVRTSQIQAIMGEYQMYQSAVKSFKSKYKALPGDFSEATETWGEISPGCQVGTATGHKTCDGDGDGIIEGDTSNYEHIAAWRHLGLSGFVKQNFTGNTVAGGACNIDIRPGENVPSSKLKGAGWNLVANGTGTPYVGGTGDSFFSMAACNNLPVVHAMWLGGSLQDDNALPASCALSQVPVLTGAEAYAIDQKFDDKRAISGKLRGQYNNSGAYTPCEESSATSGGYRTSATGMNCSLVFILPN